MGIKPLIQFVMLKVRLSFRSTSVIRWHYSVIQICTFEAPAVFIRVYNVLSHKPYPPLFRRQHWAVLFLCNTTVDAKSVSPEHPAWCWQPIPKQSEVTTAHSSVIFSHFHNFTDFQKKKLITCHSRMTAQVCSGSEQASCRCGESREPFRAAAVTRVMEWEKTWSCSEAKSRTIKGGVCVRGENR